MRAGAAAAALAVSDERHGTTNGYTNLGCRCDLCKAAWAQDGVERRRRRAERLAADPSLAPHGFEATYLNWGCRCDLCKASRQPRRIARSPQ